MTNPAVLHVPEGPTFGQQEADSWPDEKELISKPTFPVARAGQGRRGNENGPSDDEKDVVFTASEESSEKKMAHRK